MTRRRIRRAKSEINVVPYIDVMLVLLVIFMVAPQIQHGTVELPSVGKTASQTEQKPPLRIEIALNGSLRLYGIQKDGQAFVNIESLVESVKAASASPDNPRPVVIAADKNVRYEMVMNVMDKLKQADIKRIGLQVQAK